MPFFLQILQKMTQSNSYW